MLFGARENTLNFLFLTLTIACMRASRELIRAIAGSIPSPGIRLDLFSPKEVHHVEIHSSGCPECSCRVIAACLHSGASHSQHWRDQLDQEPASNRYPALV